jgi:hypothetical protein
LKPFLLRSSRPTRASRNAQRAAVRHTALFWTQGEEGDTRRRYYAACVAARAGCGQGRDAADVDEKGRAGFRQQARDWLGAELEARRRLWKEEPAQALPLVHDLKNWLGYPYLAGVRDPEGLGRLPEAERRVWQRLWQEVEALRRQAARP